VEIGLQTHHIAEALDTEKGFVNESIIPTRDMDWQD
jgi:hypothetical protein